MTLVAISFEGIGLVSQSPVNVGPCLSFPEPDRLRVLRRKSNPALGTGKDRTQKRMNQSPIRTQTGQDLTAGASGPEAQGFRLRSWYFILGKRKEGLKAGMKF